MPLSSQWEAVCDFLSLYQSSDDVHFVTHSSHLHVPSTPIPVPPLFLLIVLPSYLGQERIELAIELNYLRKEVDRLRALTSLSSSPDTNSDVTSSSPRGERHRSSRSRASSTRSRDGKRHRDKEPEKSVDDEGVRDLMSGVEVRSDRTTESEVSTGSITSSSSFAQFQSGTRSFLFSLVAIHRSDHALPHGECQWVW